MAFRGWWYLSFANDDGFVGASVVQSPYLTMDNTGMAGALLTANRLGAVPAAHFDGVLGLPVVGDPPGDESWRNRLLSRAEIDAWDDIVDGDHAPKPRHFTIKL